MKSTNTSLVYSSKHLTNSGLQVNAQLNANQVHSRCSAVNSKPMEAELRGEYHKLSLGASGQ